MNSDAAMLTASAPPPAAAGNRAAMSPDRRHRGGDLLTIALGTSVLMWAVAYVGLSPAVDAPPLSMAALGLVALLGAGITLGRLSERGAAGGAKLGLLLGFINFLIVASFHGRESTAEALRFGAVWVGGFTALAIALGAAGAAIGAGSRNQIAPRSVHAPRAAIDWTSWLAVVVAAALLPLLISGGIVTGLDAGLAVPDWLTTYGYPMMFYPLVAMQQNSGVYAEHFHRLWGMLVGLSVVLLLVHIHRVDRRLWLRLLSISVLIAVIVQGVLGAAWVLDTQVRSLAVLHGVFGQIVFATVVAIAAFTSQAWDGGVYRSEGAGGSIERKGSIMLFMLLVVQLGFGALYRHSRREAGDAMHGMHALWSHLLLATILIAVIIFVAGRAWGVHRDKPVLAALGRAMLLLLCAQLALGVAALFAALTRGTAPDPIGWEVAVTSAHQVVGAVMLATAGLLAVWSHRLLHT